MATVIDILRREHQNIARVLNALEHQTEIVAQASAPDYEVIQGIADYFCDYPDRCHHPKENVVYERLRAKYPHEAAAIGDLAREHRDASARARRIVENVHALFRDAVIPRDSFVSAVRNFIKAERRHMAMEEKIFFPLAEDRLAPEDWQNIEARLRDKRDPLFGDQIEEKFRALREQLLTWEKEYKPT